jgi:hypothetical protein
MEKSYSEKVARVFEIGCYFMIVPGILATLYSFLTIILAIPVLILFLLGIWMFKSYIKHSRGLLEESEVVLMWVLSFMLNTVFALVGVSAFSSANWSVPESIGESAWFFTALSMVGWWITAAILPITALISIKKSDNAR